MSKKIGKTMRKLAAKLGGFQACRCTCGHIWRAKYPLDSDFHLHEKCPKCGKRLKDAWSSDEAENVPRDGIFFPDEDL